MKTHKTRTTSKARNTIQKTAIKRVLTISDKPLTVEDIRHAASKFVDGLGIATVYRVLKSLMDADEVTRVSVGTTIYYELTHGHHHHFHCRECKEVLDVKGCSGNLRKLLPPGFLLEAHDLTLYGVCAKCR
jgi:Fur family ferric uptake transcriptional regulator